MTKKTIAFMLATMFALLTITTACSSTDTDANNADTITLKLAHSLTEDHPTHIALQSFADEVLANTNNEVKIEIYANGLLGSESEVLEHLKTGTVDLTRVSASALANFSEIYSTFMLPYLFEDEEHFYKVMDGEIAQEIYQAGKEDGYVGLTYFSSGARSFYTTNTPINTPADLKGLKIRVMEDPYSIEMMRLFQASATPLAYGEIYTALQQGVIDGAENNPTALTLGKHGEVTKYYSFNEHTRIPDILVIAPTVWDTISPENQEIIKTTASKATQDHRVVWDQSTQDAIEIAETSLGVTFVYPDKKPFEEAVAPLYESLKENALIYDVVDKIKNAK